jgi:hypothetical protein
LVGGGACVACIVVDGGRWQMVLYLIWSWCYWLTEAGVVGLYSVRKDSHFSFVVMKFKLHIIGFDLFCDTMGSTPFLRELLVFMQKKVFI